MSRHPLDAYRTGEMLTDVLLRQRGASIHGVVYEPCVAALASFVARGSGGTA